MVPSAKWLGWVVQCHALYQAVGVAEWSDTHEQLQEVSKTHEHGVKKAGQEVEGLVRQPTLQEG